jgi:hypothetical protein
MSPWYRRGPWLQDHVALWRSVHRPWHRCQITGGARGISGRSKGGWHTNVHCGHPPWSDLLAGCESRCWSTNERYQSFTSPISAVTANRIACSMDMSTG